MNCDDAQRLLAAHADGELGLPHAAELEAHLEGCAGCRGSLAGLTELRANVRAHAIYHTAPARLAARSGWSDGLPRSSLAPAPTI